MTTNILTIAFILSVMVAWRFVLFYGIEFVRLIVYHLINGDNHG